MQPLVSQVKENNNNNTKKKKKEEEKKEEEKNLISDINNYLPWGKDSAV